MEEYIYKKMFDLDTGMDTIVRDLPLPPVSGDLMFRTILTTNGEDKFEMTKVLCPINPTETDQYFDWEDVRKDDWDLYLEGFKKEISRKMPIWNARSQASSFWTQSYLDGSHLCYMYDLASEVEKLFLTNIDPAWFNPGSLNFSTDDTFIDIDENVIQKNIEAFFEE